MRIRSTLVTLTVAAVTASLITGCSKTPALADLTAQEIFAKAREATTKAASYQAKGTLVSEGQEMTVDMTVNGDDVKMAAEMTVDLFGDVSFELLVVGSDNYVKLPDELTSLLVMASEEFAENPGLMSEMNGKWLKADPNDPDTMDFAPLGNVGSKDPLVDIDAATLSKGEPTTVNNVPVIPLTDGETTYYIATEGEPYLIRMEGPDGKLDFSNWGTAPAITAPAADEVIDLAGLNISMG